MIRFLSILCICLSVLACQKEISGDYGIVPRGSGTGSGTGGGTGGGGGGTNDSIVGAWKFESLLANTEADIKENSAGTELRVITRTVYTAKQQTGTMTFTTDGKASTNNLGYSVDTTAVVLTYLDGDLIDSSVMPVTSPFISSSANTTYSLKGADSITLGTSLVSMGGTTTTSSGGTYWYSIANRRLTMKLSGTKDSSFTQAGSNIIMKQKVSVTMTFIK